jgi:hypothetical protein
MFKSLSITALLLLSFSVLGSNIKKGDRVQYNQGQYKYTGSVESIYSGSVIYIKTDFKRSYVYRDNSDVGFGVDCAGRICAGDEIVFKANDVLNSGKVHEVFSNQTVNIGGTSHFPIVKALTEVGKSYRCVENLCIGEKLNLDSYGVATIIKVFDNGIVYLKISKSSSDASGVYSFKTFNEIGFSETCLVNNNRSTCKVVR